MVLTDFQRVLIVENCLFFDRNVPRRWGLPKGQPLPAEAAHICAVRETREETGYEPDLTEDTQLVQLNAGTGDFYVLFFAH